jgi:uncharacterized membrane protein YozB (DUF420 family)
MNISSLPALNALLNSFAFLLLVTGYLLIKQGRREAHRKVMIAAFTVSCIFLISYLTYHFQVGSVSFQKQGPIRTVYLAILLSHTLCAACVGVLAPITLIRGLRGRFGSHVRMARITYPLWVYVSLTGVIVYLMLYRM